MIRVFLLVALSILISAGLSGQCPTLTLSSTSGNTCSLSPVTVTDNTFEDAAKVTLKEDGAGSVSPGEVTISPFSFTYTPKSGDLGKTVTITLTTNNPPGPCNQATATFLLSVSSLSAPVIGDIIQPGCITLTGTVTLTGLPSPGSWTLTRLPDNITTNGTGTSAQISDLSPGTYSFTVTNSSGCVSPSSADIVISSNPVIPQAPVIGTITSPTCTTPTGSVILSRLPSAGAWTLIRYPGNVNTSGSGSSTTVSGIPPGDFNFTVTNSAGCVSGMSAKVSIPSPPGIPTPPLIGPITQPQYINPTGTVVLNDLPGNGNWTLTLAPGNVTTTGSGTTVTIQGLAPGIYSFTVTNASGCKSSPSADFEINAVSGPPIVKITNPLPVCSPSTVDITLPAITAGSTPNLIYTYWTDSLATKPYPTPGLVTAGIYYIKGTAPDGFSTVKPVTVRVYNIPVANGGPDQTLIYVFNTRMNAVLSFNYESGIWSLVKGSGILADSTDSKTTVSGLSLGKNKFVWKVTNHICPPSTDTVIITVHDKAVPTLITPNNDGINDYLILKESDSPYRMDLLIFDRRGAEVYRNRNYDNSWNGIDYNGNQLPDDTYFYVLKSENGTSSKGFVVIRRLK